MTISVKDMDGVFSAEKFADESIEELTLKWQPLIKAGMLTAPNKIFPQDTVARIYERAALFLELSKKSLRKPYALAVPIAEVFIKSSYSFTDNLHTGQYAPYPHEQIECNIAGNNCTTVIPEAYLFCEAVGLKPEIIQFFDFKDIETKKDEEEAVSPSHYSLIIDVSRKHKYFFDPFYSLFGPILRQEENYIQVGRCQGRAAQKRTFRKILSYSAQDFVEMIDRLHDPAESLDMLVAGQKFQKKTVAKTSCTFMIYYHDESNTVSTRVYIPQKPLTDKAVYARMALNDEGDITKLLLECYLAKDAGWDFLVDGKKVCETDFSTASSLRRGLQGLKNQEGKKFQLKNHERVVPALLQADKRNRESLLGITDKLYQKLTEAERQKLRSQILARVLYESERPSEKYLYASEEHDARLLGLAKQEREGRIKIQPIKDLLWLQGWKLQKLERNETRKARYEKRRHDEKICEIVEEIDVLNFLRDKNKKAYSRAMDKVLFSETLKGCDLDDLEKMVNGQNLDLRIGYLAMVADFITFILESEEDLKLKLYWQPIKEKVAARRKKKAVLQESLQIPAQQSTASPGLELAVAE